MKRFVELPAIIGVGSFCWYDTVVDQIETHNGQTVWQTFADFEADYKGADIERYWRLYPKDREGVTND